MTPSTPILFIGGPMDGKRLAIPDDPLPSQYCVPVLADSLSWKSLMSHRWEDRSSSGLDKPLCKTYTYLLNRVRVDNSTELCWFYVGEDVGSWMRLLLDRYPLPGEKKRHDTRPTPE